MAGSSSLPAPASAMTQDLIRQDVEALAAIDADIARAYGDVGCPPLRERPQGFAHILRTIISQQLSIPSANAILGRLDAIQVPMTPERFLQLDDAALRAIGLSGRKIDYGRGLAERVISGALDIDGLARLEDEAAIAALVAVRGIGRWTAEIYLMFSLGRRDIWPVDDLAVRVALQRLKRLEDRPTARVMHDHGDGWRPYRSAGARLLWHYYRNAPAG